MKCIECFKEARNDSIYCPICHAVYTIREEEEKPT